MLALALIKRKSRLKIVKICIKNGSYQPFTYLLSICLHKTNMFYTGY